MTTIVPAKASPPSGRELRKTGGVVVAALILIGLLLYGGWLFVHPSSVDLKVAEITEVDKLKKDLADRDHRLADVNSLAREMARSTIDRERKELEAREQTVNAKEKELQRLTGPFDEKMAKFMDEQRAGMAALKEDMKKLSERKSGGKGLLADEIRKLRGLYKEWIDREVELARFDTQYGGFVMAGRRSAMDDRLRIIEATRSVLERLTEQLSKVLELLGP